MKDRYVLDSSIWIAIERGNPSILQRVEPLIEGNRICLVDVIVAEVLRGTRTRRDYHRMRKAFSDFPMISTEWEKVSLLAFDVGQRGFHPPLIDLYIAQAVRETWRTLLTQDRHFGQIATVRHFSFEILLPP